MTYMDKHYHVFKPFRIGIVLVDGFALMSYAAAMEPLRASNLIAGRQLYDIQHMPAVGARAVSSSGAIVGATTYLGEQIDFDLVLVVAGSESLNVSLKRLEHWLRLLVSRNVLVGGVSAGPLILARAGVMEGHRLTVHWEHAQLLRAVSANLFIERTLFVRDRGRLTCAGGTAAMDMMHALISEHHGARFAQRVSDWFVHTEVRAPENPQVSGIAERYGVLDIHILKALKAMENHLDDPLTLTQLSDVVGVSARHLNRLFGQHLSTSAVDFYTRFRLHKSTALLKTGLMSVGDVAQATGFANTAHFSRQFSRAFGVSPSRYRANPALLNVKDYPEVG